MHVISKKALRAFWAMQPAAERPLRRWFKAAEAAAWHSFAEVRAVYTKADQVGRFTVFNVGGNKYRLITVIHYNREKVYIRNVLTHAEYNRGDWKGG
jgi:mRNA interferase HigB